MRLRVFEPNLGWREAWAAASCVLRRRVSPGEKVAEFESLLCKETGAKYAICCNSGTTALMLAMKTVPWKCVAVPSYTFLAAANAAVMLGRTVEQWEIGRNLQMRAYLAREDRTAIFVEHNGRPVHRMLLGLLAKSCSPIVDAAQSLGTLRMVDAPYVATVSFSGPKVVTTGQGGCVLTNCVFDREIVLRALDHGGCDWRSSRIHGHVGGNFRMSDVQAAIGCVQMKRLPELLGIRRQRFAWYREHFPDMPEDGWCALVRSEAAKACIAELNAHGYEALQPYRPLQESVPYRHLPVDPEAVKAADELLYLPVHWKASKRDIDAICAIIKGVDRCATGN